MKTYAQWEYISTNPGRSGKYIVAVTDTGVDRLNPDVAYWSGDLDGGLWYYDGDGDIVMWACMPETPDDW